MSLVIDLDESKCVGCNKCIAECPVEGANIAYLKNGESKVKTNHDECILCGRCLDVCDHGARSYRDDTESFFSDLMNGEKIAIIAAPSLRFNFDNYKQLFGYLKEVGATQFLDVALGADIATWGYLRSAENNHTKSFISQACPSIVSYIEKHYPELIDHLAPTHSPVLCLAIYMKKYLGINDKIAFLSPCISKYQEIRDTNDLVYYNVTYKKLKSYIERKNINLSTFPEKDFDTDACGLGVAFSRPGGLKEYVEYLSDNKAWVRQIEGIDNAYSYLKTYASRINENKPSPFIVDILNCTHGCNLGTGTCKDADIDDIDEITDRLKFDNIDKTEAFKDGKKIYTLFEVFDKQLDIKDFTRTYTNKLTPAKIREFTKADYDRVFNTLYKFDEASRKVNCFACGYGNCREFAKAVLNGDNHPENCINYNRAIAKAEHQEVLQQKMKAEAATRAKSDFLSNMSHEIRTPMNTVMGMTELLLDTPLTQEQKTWATIINQSGDALLTLINDVLDLTKIEENKITLENISFNLCATVAEVTNALLIDMREKGLELIVCFAPQVPLFITGDPGRFKQILFNLIGNAAKFTQHGHIFVRISCAHEKTDMTLHVEVEDTGIGIPEDKIFYIFEKFAQAEESTTRRFGGSGLGLAIAQRLVALMAGKMSVISEEGKGSTFSFDIRVQEGQATSTASEIPAISLANKRALVLDDYPTSGEAVASCLRTIGLRAEASALLQEAYKKIRLAHDENDPYEFIILDNKLCENTGMTMIDELVSANSTNHRPISIILTSYAYYPPPSDLASHGINGLIVKPYLPSQIESTLKMALQARTDGIQDLIVTNHASSDFFQPDAVIQEAKAALFKDVKILIAEDMPFNRLLMSKLLSKYGCDPDMSEDGIQTIEKVRTRDYDIIFMDCQMPKMDGYEATKIIREIEFRTNKHTPIVALTADAMTADKEKCLRSGMDDHIGKPFKQEQVLDMIKKWVPKVAAEPTDAKTGNDPDTHPP